MSCKHRIYFLWILYFLCFVPQQCLQSAHERKLYKDLFESYTVLERPVHNDNEKIFLTISLSLMQILKVDIQQQVLVTNMWKTLRWNDANLRWVASDYGNVTNIRVPSDKIWKPDVLMFNNADDKFDDNYHRTNVIVDNDGNCTYITPGIFRSTCKIDMTWFPFDEQKCEMKFASWTLNGNELDLIVESENYLSSFIENEEWQIKSFSSRRNEIYYACCPEPYVDVTFMLHIKRKSDYYHYNVIIPCVVIAFCGLLIFVLHPDSGSKLTFGIATFAIFYICQCNFSEFLTHSSVALIHIYFAYLLDFILLSLFLSVFVLNVHYRTSKMPKWIRSLFVERLPHFLMIRKCRQRIIHKSPSDVLSKAELNDIEDRTENSCLILFELRKINEKFQRDDLVDEIRNDWKFVAIVLDRIFLVIFATLLIIFTIRVWALY